MVTHNPDFGKQMTPETSRTVAATISTPANPTRISPELPLSGRPNVLALLKALRKRYLPALLLGLLCGGLVAGAIWLIIPKSKHSARTRLWIQEKPLMFPKERDGADNQRTQASLLRSPKVLSKALDKEELQETSFVQKNTDPVKKLEKEIQVDFDSPVIFRISLEGDKPQELVKIVKAVAESYIDEFEAKEKRLRNKRLEELNNKKSEFEQKVSGKLLELHELAEGVNAGDANGIAVNQEVNLMIKRWAEKELFEIKTKMIKLGPELELEWRKHFRYWTPMLYGFPPSGLPANLVLGKQLHERQVNAPIGPPTKVAEPVFTADKMLNDFLMLKAELEHKIRNVIPKAFNPKKAKVMIKEHEDALQQVMEDIAKRKMQLTKGAAPQQRLPESHLEFLIQKTAALREYEKGLKEEIDRLDKAAKALAGAPLLMNKLNYELDHLRNMETKIAMQILAEEVEKNALPEVEVYEAAAAYPPPMIGRRETMSAAGGGGSLMLILFAFAWFEFRSRRVDSREDIVQNLGMMQIGALPDFSYRPRLGFFKSRAPDDSARHRILMDSVDAARNMILTTAENEPLQVLLITSAMVGEGKTSAAGHLAASLARTGKKTLLVDCDLRNPNVHRLFDAIRTPGLSEALRGECDITETVQQAPTDGLYVISGGQFNLQTLSFFSRTRTTEILNKLRQEFEFVILDSSPILLVPESHLLAKYSDAVVMSVLRNVSKLPQVHHATELLSRLGTRTLGFIMSGVRDEIHYSSSYYVVENTQPA